MAEFGSTENILWFYAVFLFTVPPVLRFRENFLVPLLSTLMVFGFYTQSYWMPDFYSPIDWLWIGFICTEILAAYFICGFLVHFVWFRGKSERLREHGAFSPLLKAWVYGKSYVVADEFITEIRRLRMFEVAWDDIKKVSREDDYICVSDGVLREPEVLSEIKIDKCVNEYSMLNKKLKELGF